MRLLRVGAWMRKIFAFISFSRCSKAVWCTTTRRLFRYAATRQEPSRL